MKLNGNLCLHLLISERGRLFLLFGCSDLCGFDGLFNKFMWDFFLLLSLICFFADAKVEGEGTRQMWLRKTREAMA